MYELWLCDGVGETSSVFLDTHVALGSLALIDSVIFREGIERFEHPSSITNIYIVCLFKPLWQGHIWLLAVRYDLKP